MVRSKIWLFALFVTLGSLQMTGCDFNAASDAFDDFDIILGLEPINTVVSGVIVDAGTGELIGADLRFSGPDADAVIDAYSDPVESIDAPDGSLTFGISNARVPTPSAPVQVTITASAPGYYTTSTELLVSETGQEFFEIELAQNNVTSQIAGTAGQTDSRVSSSNEGQVAQAVVIQTGFGSNQGQAQMSVDVLRDTRITTAGGTPLQGQIQTQLRVYDSGRGLAALPSGARVNAAGTTMALAGAAFFRMSDGLGRVALQFSGGVGKGGGAACAGTSISLQSTNADIVAAVSAAGGSIPVDVYVYTPADGKNVSVGSLTASLDGGQVQITVCFDASGSINLGAVGDVSAGMIFSFALSGSAANASRLDRSITVTNNGSGALNAVFELVGPGVRFFRDKTIPVGTTTHALSDLVGRSGDVTLIQSATYSLSASLETGAAQSVTFVDPSSGSTSLTLPTSSGLAAFNFKVTMACPAGGEFKVQVSEESLDALLITYRAQVPGSKWKAVPKGSASKPVITSGSVSLSVSLSMRTNTPYLINGTLDNKSTQIQQTSPASGGPWNVSLNPKDIGLECK